VILGLGHFYTSGARFPIELNQETKKARQKDFGSIVFYCTPRESEDQDTIPFCDIWRRAARMHALVGRASFGPRPWR